MFELYVKSLILRVKRIVTEDKIGGVNGAKAPLSDGRNAGFEVVIDFQNFSKCRDGTTTTFRERGFLPPRVRAIPVPSQVRDCEIVRVNPYS